MKQNMNTRDRIIRLIFGLICLVIIFIVKQPIIIVILAILALFTFYEALAGWCAFYALIGKNTCPINYNQDKK